MTQISDDFYLGNATGPGSDTGGRGIGPMARTWYYSVTPTTLGTTNIAGTQAMSTSLTLAGPTLTRGTAILDVPRSVRIVNTGTNDLSGTNVTVSGFDQYGARMTATLAAPAATATVETDKTFKSVTSIAFPGTSANVVSAGTGDRFGLPYRVTNASYVVSTAMIGTGTAVIALDQGTVRPADTTSPATASTGDVRGWYQPASASNGTRILLVAAYAQDNQAGPLATQANVYGVTQA